jgi:hypothetical protein
VIGANGYGDAEMRRHDDGRIEVLRADDVIGISLELLVEAVGQGLQVDADGFLWLGGDGAYRYRPVRFASSVHGLPPGTAAEGARVLVCERVR